MLTSTLDHFKKIDGVVFLEQVVQRQGVFTFTRLDGRTNKRFFISFEKHIGDIFFSCNQHSSYFYKHAMYPVPSSLTTDSVISKEYCVIQFRNEFVLIMKDKNHPFIYVYSDQ